MQNKLSIMLKRLETFYDREDEISAQLRRLYLEFEQLQEDKELLETMIMFLSNKQYREKQYSGVK